MKAIKINRIHIEDEQTDIWPKFGLSYKLVHSSLQLRIAKMSLLVNMGINFAYYIIFHIKRLN